ncbi:MAG: hypothetical protein DRR08_03525 [Candidatus Parabeggiatoa sp. nov. 2]|nr:MAG: hypothetical protein B6247_14110 [Beggiatoa sp. 4572_84]RKZ63413.1 MAG: hypothetical protein DRR08_03525 [Gammaproteobacteria bacterium]
MNYYSAGAELRFSYKPKYLKGFYVEVGGLIDYRKWSTKDEDYSFSFPLDREILYKPYAQIGYIF